jgi:hypothetical protein
MLEEDESMDLNSIYERMKDNFHVLSNFKEIRMKGRSKKEYTNLLMNDLSTTFGIP